jgi:hypothetical protein
MDYRMFATLGLVHGNMTTLFVQPALLIGHFESRTSFPSLDGIGINHEVGNRSHSSVSRQNQ